MSESPYETAFRELSSRKEDVKPSDVVVFSEPLRSALNFVIRLGRFSLTDFCNKLGFTRYQAKKLADILVERHLFVVQRDASKPPDETFYEARLSAPARPVAARKSIDIWKKLD
jgi:hypothetical protein